MKSLSITSITLGAVFTILCSTAEAAIINTFDTDAEGWTVVSFTNLSADNYSVVGTYGVTYSATGGNPGGFISSADPDAGDFTFAAPAATLAALAGAFGTTVSYDITHTGVVDYQSSDVILEGGGVRLLWMSAPPLVPNASWTTVSLTLAPSPQWHLATTNGATPTNADFQTALASATGFYLRGEFAANNRDESAGIDNVLIVPEPSSFALLAVSIAAYAFLFRRSNNRKMA